MLVLVIFAVAAVHLHHEDFTVGGECDIHRSANAGNCRKSSGVIVSVDVRVTEAVGRAVGEDGIFVVVAAGFGVEVETIVDGLRPKYAHREIARMASTGSPMKIQTFFSGIWGWFRLRGASVGASCLCGCQAEWCDEFGVGRGADGRAPRKALEIRAGRVAVLSSFSMAFFRNSAEFRRQVRFTVRISAAGSVACLKASASGEVASKGALPPSISKRSTPRVTDRCGRQFPRRAPVRGY